MSMIKYLIILAMTVSLEMTSDDRRIERATTECYYRNTLPSFSQLASDWLVIKPRPKARIFFDAVSGRQMVYYHAREYTITNLYRFAEYARWADPNNYPESSGPPTVAKSATVDPNDWTLEQKALYLQIMIMLGE